MPGGNSRNRGILKKELSALEVSHIPPDIASLVRDILIKPDATDPYYGNENRTYNRLGANLQRKKSGQLSLSRRVRFSPIFRTIEKYDATRSFPVRGLL
ncbi:hypothetical protein TNCV_843081 [Trichonephila clavipes]|nr:hypothetical protein TNCV_843081 [Trichonephila clavipes]